MAGEIGYVGGKSIFDDYVRDVRPRFLVPRTFQRTVYRPGELVQCDLWESAEQIPVGHGQRRRGWVVTCEVCWSRGRPVTIAGIDWRPVRRFSRADQRPLERRV